MLSEKNMEDAICMNPEKYLGEPGLKLIARQYRIGSYIFDLLFEDRHGAKLIVEIQKGTLDRNHTYKILDYYDEYKEKNPNSFIELMIIASKIPYERRNRLDSKGISWKEIPESELQEQINNPEPPKPLTSIHPTPTGIQGLPQQFRNPEPRYGATTGRSTFGHGDGTQGQVMDDAILSLVREGKEVTAQAVWSMIKNVRKDIKGLARVKNHFYHLKRYHSWDGKGYASTEHKAS